jgi:hypothetical protein
MPSDNEHLESAAEPIEKNQIPETETETEMDSEAESESADTAPKKRNCGRTGPKNTYRSSRNATRHGMCAETLILDHENEADWLNLLSGWLDQYDNPAETTVLYTFVVKTAQAEWHRLRIQKEYNAHLRGHSIPPITAWEPFEIQAHDLVQRYLTAAERKFQREYKMLEHHWRSHHKPAPAPKEKAQKPAPEPRKNEPHPVILFVNNETGEAVDNYGKQYPAPPDYKSRPIIPGVYDPDHPAYQGPYLGQNRDS